MGQNSCFVSDEEGSVSAAGVLFSKSSHDGSSPNFGLFFLIDSRKRRRMSTLSFWFTLTVRPSGINSRGTMAWISKSPSSMTFPLGQTGQTQNHIALAIASLGIAAIDGGRTAHSALKVPLNVRTNPDAMCNIKKHSGMAEVLRKFKIIIWDKCAMAHKHSLEALDRNLKDIKNNTRLFGGALLLLSGDFRQTLPVILRATYADKINACLKESYLSRSISKLCLTINMRV
ncbi:ATP-dependent DNA helicase [Trichonephila clavipes]|nr:ATP-dependent DNA helicase [Trichonephila clavipes]